VFVSAVVLDHQLAVHAHPGRLRFLWLLARIHEFQDEVLLGALEGRKEGLDGLAHVALGVLRRGVGSDGNRSSQVLENLGGSLRQSVALAMRQIPLDPDVPGNPGDGGRQPEQQHHEQAVLEQQLQSQFAIQFHARRRSASRRRIESMRKVAVSSAK
jgi:hypothetical protein